MSHVYEVALNTGAIVVGFGLMLQSVLPALRRRLSGVPRGGLRGLNGPGGAVRAEAPPAPAASAAWRDAEGVPEPEEEPAGVA